MNNPLYDLNVGDRVHVFGNNGSRSGEPKDGWEGEVTKIGRKLITVKYRHREEQFRLETGQYNSKNWASHLWIRTPEQVAEQNHRTDLNKRLREHGLELTMGRRNMNIFKLEAVVAVLDGFDG